jgi:ThiF family/Prokaryotic homologs of the JAB domain
VTITLRITAGQLQELREHLLKPDDCESVALVLCGVRRTAEQLVLMVHEISNIPDDRCSIRLPDAVRWPTEMAIPLMTTAIRRGMALLKFHSHPGGYDRFSDADDTSDRVLATAMRGFADEKILFASAFLLPTGDIRLRLYQDAAAPSECDRVVVVGDNIQFIDAKSDFKDLLDDEATLRTRQAFGEGTTSLLRRLAVGVVGCSGTGSWVVEMLARLGVAKLVLVDPDYVERKNLNRIINTTAADAAGRQPKTMVLARAIAAIGIGTKAETFQTDLDDRAAVLALAGCDFLFGCVDSADGRDALNRIATFYLLPLIDVGVRLDGDGKGGINQITAAIHYLLPGGSTLLTRGVITAKQVSDHALWRTDRERYEALKAEGYVHGVAVDSPAVISINGFAASHAVNEMLARLHPFRTDGNEEFRHQAFSLTEGSWIRVSDDRRACEYLAKKVGRGDCRPLIENPGIR